MALTDLLFLALCLMAKLSVPLFLLHKGRIRIAIILALLSFWHTFFGYYYYSYSLSGVADSNYYYGVAEKGEAVLGIGTRFAEFFAQGIYSVAAGSKMAMFFIYSIIGFWGLIFFFFSMNYSSRLIPLLIFLPGLSFWSVAIGKEPLVMFVLGMSAYIMKNFKYVARYYLILLFLLFLALLIRPHIALIMIAALGLAFLKDAKLRPSYFIGILALSALLLVATPTVLENLGLQEASFDAFSSKVEERQSVYADTDMGLDLSEMPFYYIYFSYMFRPLPFEVTGLSAFMVSIENVILLFIFIFCVLNMRKLKTLMAGVGLNFPLLFFLLGWVSLALVTGNLGIAIRQKMMLVPFLLIIFSWLYSVPRGEGMRE